MILYLILARKPRYSVISEEVSQRKLITFHKFCKSLGSYKTLVFFYFTSLDKTDLGQLSQLILVAVERNGSFFYHSD